MMDKEQLCCHLISKLAELSQVARDEMLTKGGSYDLEKPLNEAKKAIKEILNKQGDYF